LEEAIVLDHHRAEECQRLRHFNRLVKDSISAEKSANLAVLRMIGQDYLDGVGCEVLLPEDLKDVKAASRPQGNVNEDQIGVERKDVRNRRFSFVTTPTDLGPRCNGLFI
jgi:hypothetical protein